MRIPATLLSLVLAGQVVLAGQDLSDECTPEAEASHIASIRWSGPEGVPIGGVAAAVSYPPTVLVIPGAGTALPSDTRVEAPPGAMVAINDGEGEVKLVVAAAGGLVGDLLARVRFGRCEGAKAPATDAMRCRVLSASDDATNAVDGVTCSVRLD